MHSHHHSHEAAGTDRHSHRHHHGRRTPHPSGHNRQGEADHLHSHVHGHSNKERAAEIQTLATSFIDGFRAAEDKNSYLRLSSIPFRYEGEDGLALHLVDASIVANWQIGTASPAFASRELVYMPFPGAMIAQRETMTFTYVSLTKRLDVDLLTLLAERVSHLDTEPHHHD